MKAGDFKNLLQGVREAGSYLRSKRNAAARIERRSLRVDEDDAPPPSRTQRAELDRRLRDLKDPTRYVIVSPLFRRLTTLYDVASGNFAMGHWTESCLFKRRAEAEAVARALDRGRKIARGRFRLQVVAVTQITSGIRFVEPIKDPCHRGRTWKPRLRRTRIERPSGNAEATDTRAHILRGFIFALENFEEIARAIRASRDRIVASKRLQTRFSLSTRQAEALLDLRLFHLTVRERRSLKRERAACDEAKPGRSHLSHDAIKRLDGKNRGGAKDLSTNPKHLADYGS